MKKVFFDRAEEATIIIFSYITNSSLDSEVFQRVFKKFIGAANVVNQFKELRILQISTRPSDF